MAESFGVEDRGHFYDPVGALRDVVVNHLMQVRRRGRDGGRRPAATRTTLKDAQVALFRAIAAGRPGPLRARPVRRATSTSTAWRRTRPPRRTPRCAWTSTTGAGRACRSSSAPASGCRSPRPSCGSCSSDPPRLGLPPAWSARARARPARRQARPVDRRPADRLDAQRADAPGPSRSPRHGVRRGGRRGADAVRGAAARRDGRRQHPVHPPGRRRGDLADHAAAARRATAGPAVRAGHLGPGRGRPAGRRPRPLARALDRTS